MCVGVRSIGEGGGGAVGRREWGLKRMEEANHETVSFALEIGEGAELRRPIK